MQGYALADSAAALRRVAARREMAPTPRMNVPAEGDGEGKWLAPQSKEEAHAAHMARWRRLNNSSAVRPKLAPFSAAPRSADSDEPRWTPKPIRCRVARPVVKYSHPREGRVDHVGPFAPPERMTIAAIKLATAMVFGVHVDDIAGHRRTKDVVRPRQIAMYLSRHHTTMSLPVIGRAFSGRDHTTVIHAIVKIGELQESEESIREKVDAIRRLLSL